MKVLLTGGAGFVGHHVCEHILKNTDWEIVVLDKLNYSSTFDRLRDIKAFDDRRVKTLATDFTRPIEGGLRKEIGNPDYILHLGAETHVDNSIANPEPFVMTNVVGTMRMLEFAREVKPKWFVYFSTDEVFGPAPKGVFYKEWDRYNSANPYSATKAGGEELCLAYANTYGVRLFITHCMNIFGERQHPEKFIPNTIKKVLNYDNVIIHSNPDKTESGTRHWIHARNVASAILFLLDRAEPREKYNIVGEEYSNLDIARVIAHTLKRHLLFEMVDFHSSRPGHDLRYALDGSKLAGMGWKAPVDTIESLQKTIEWTVNNQRWL